VTGVASDEMTSEKKKNREYGEAESDIRKWQERKGHRILEMITCNYNRR
jgi:hypothetical protein